MQTEIAKDIQNLEKNYGPILVDIHSHNLVQSEKTFRIYNYRLGFDTANCNDLGYFSAGYHPWDVKNNLDLLEDMAKHPKLLMIGETGLDRHRDENFAAQLQSFEVHIELAKKLKKPLVLHAVKSHSDILQVLKQHQYEGILIHHDFAGTIETVKQYGHYQSYFSFGQSLIHHRPKLGEVFQSLPLEKIFLETDDQCQMTLEEIYQKACELRACSYSDLKFTLWNNLKEVILSGTET